MRTAARTPTPGVSWWALGRGRSHVRLHDVAAVELVCRRPLPLQVAGEDLGDVERVVLEAEPDAVTVFV